MGEKGWSQEGLGWYSADETDSEKAPIYRQYNPNAFYCNHNYTIDAKEKDNVISAGWNDEGIGWYGYEDEKSPTQTLDFSKITVTTTAKTYNGKGQTQTITSSAYKLETDYTAIYSNNINAGTASITIAGKGNYTGSKTYNFTINKATPVCNAPTDLMGKLGDTLSTIDIATVSVSGNTAGKFTWGDGTKTMSEAGEKEFSASFIPTDTANYLTVKNVQVKVYIVAGKGYWLGTKNAGEEYVNEAYFAKNDKNYVSGDDIAADMAVLHDSTSSTYTEVKAKWDKFYSDDNVRLYATYKSGETESSYSSSYSNVKGETSVLNKYIEFRILEVSETTSGHDSDGSAVTFMATHLLPTAYSMNASDTNEGGWNSSKLCDKMNFNGENDADNEIYDKFSSDFVAKVKSTTKKYGTGNATTNTSSGSYKFWLLSASELVGSSAPIQEGAQYAWCSKNNITSSSPSTSLKNWKTRAGATPGSAYYTTGMWWERSPYSDASTNFLFVYSDLGYPIAYSSYGYSKFGNAGYAWGVVPAFCF